jgi:hypothetical protein
MRRLLLVILAAAATSVPAFTADVLPSPDCSRCDCKHFPFKPEPPCEGCCGAALLLKASQKQLEEIVGLSDTVSSKLIRRRGTSEESLGVIFDDAGLTVSEKAEVKQKLDTLTKAKVEQIMKVGTATKGISPNQP